MKILRNTFQHFLQTISFFVFPSQFRYWLQKMRGVKLGKNVFIGQNVYLDNYDPDMISIGDNSFITTGVIILVHQRDLSNYAKGILIKNCPLKTDKVIIEDNVHIGMGSIILPGITIGKGVIIAAGSVVTKDIPAYSLAAGVPAKVIKEYK